MKIVKLRRLILKAETSYLDLQTEDGEVVSLELDHHLLKEVAHIVADGLPRPGNGRYVPRSGSRAGASS
jgi:hypothetical protein